MDVHAEQVQRLEPLPITAPYETFAFRDPPSGGLHHREPEVRRGLGEHARRVADGDVALRRGGDIDVVVADPELCDHPEVRTGCVHYGDVDGVRNVGEYAEGARGRRPQLLRRRRRGTVQYKDVRDLT